MRGVRGKIPAPIQAALGAASMASRVPPQVGKGGFLGYAALRSERQFVGGGRAAVGAGFSICHRDSMQRDGSLFLTLPTAVFTFQDFMASGS